MAIDRQATVRRAESLVQAGKVDQAIAEYSSILEAYPDDWGIANTLGDLHARMGRSDRAAEIFSSIGDAFFAQGFFPKAVAHYKKVLKARPGDDHALSSLANAAVEQELYADARLYLGQLLQQRRARGNAAGVAECEARLEAVPDRRAMARRSAPGAPAAPEPSGSATGVRSAAPAPAPHRPDSTPARPPVPPAEAAPAATPEGPSVSGSEAGVEDPAETILSTPEADAADDAFVLDGVPYEIEVFSQGRPGPSPSPSPSTESADDDAETAAAPMPVPRAASAPAVPPPGSRPDRTPPATPEADLFDDDGEVVDLDLDQWLDDNVAATPAVVAEPETPVPSTATEPDDADDAPRAAALPLGDRTGPSVETAIESPAASAASSAVFAASADDARADVATLAAELEAAAASPSLRFQASAQLGRLWMQEGDLDRAVTWLTRAAEASSPVREQGLAVQYELADALERVGRTSEALRLLRDIELDAGGFRDVRTRIARLEAAGAAGPES